MPPPYTMQLPFAEYYHAVQAFPAPLGHSGVGRAAAHIEVNDFPRVGGL